MSCIADEVGFVHLRVHSAYSLLEGALPIKKLAELAEADRMPALGIADTGNLFGALEFAEKMVEKGIQPIVGCQVAVDFGDAPEADRPGAAAPEAPRRYRPHRGERGGLLEPRPPGLDVLHGDRARRPRPSRGRRRWPARTDGLIALTGGPAGRSTGRSRPGRASLPPRGSTGSPRSSRDRLYVELQRHVHAGRRGGRAASRRSRLSPRPAAGRDQRGRSSRRATTTRRMTR